MKNTRKKSLNKKRLVLLSLGVIIVIAALSFGAYALFKDEAPKPVATTSDENTINLDPPTEAEIQQSTDAKEEFDKPTTPAETANDGRQKVTPLIVNADKSGASAYITSIFEDGGTCTATFTHEGDKITTTSKGFQNSSYTSCEPLLLSSPLNIRGDWYVTVSYSSTTSNGNSASYGPIQVQ